MGVLASGMAMLVALPRLRVGWLIYPPRKPTGVLKRTPAQPYRGAKADRARLRVGRPEA